MPVPAAIEWIETTPLSIAIREGAFPYPIIGAVHLLSIALFGGMVVATNLRLLGWAMPSYAVSDLIRGLRPWKCIGGIVIATTGFLLTWAEPVRLYGSPSFWTKMGLFALVGVHAAVFRPYVYRNPEKLDARLTWQAKVAAALSLMLWAGLILSGRLIAFDASFD